MFTGQSLLKVLAVMEEELALNRFVAEGVHLWPIARSCFGAKNADNSVAPEHRASELRRLDDAVDALYDRVIATPTADKPAAAFGPDALTPARSGDGVLVFTRTEDHYLKTPRGHYTPVLDPWVELAAKDWPCRKVELGGARFAASQPRVFATDPFPGANVDQSHAAQLNALLQAARPLAALMTAWLAKELAYDCPDFATDLLQYLTNLWVEKEQLAQLLTAARPRLVITSCAYLRPTASIAWAAREQAIPVVDVQHGGNGPFHMGYSHWRHVPEFGYRATPDHYFVWDVFSANNIARWLPANANLPRAAITGRFDLEFTRRAYMGDKQGSPITLATFNSAKTILVTLQPLKGPVLSPLMIDVMKAAPADWTWLIRSHPMAVAWKRADMMPEAIEATLRSHGIARAESQMSTALPLAIILPHVNHHLTGFSGTVQECAAFGVRTTFTHGAARFYFPQYMDAGIATLCGTVDDVMADVLKPAPDAMDIPRDPDRARQVLQRLLG
jgi:hypothetical protein